MDNTSNAYQLGLYEKSMPNTLTWIEKLTCCKEAGFDYVEMSIDETEEKQARLNYSEVERKALVDDMWESGVPIKSICLSAHRKYPLGSHNKKIQEKALEMMEKAILLASDLGVRIIQLAGYDVFYEKGDSITKEAFISNLRIAVQMAAKRGISLGFETMETPFMDTVEKAMEYVNLVHSPYLGVYPDIGNLKNASLLYKGNVNDDLSCGKGHLLAAHVKETIPGIYREIPFGTGHTDYLTNIATLKELGVMLYVGEFWYCGSSTWMKDLIEANAFLRGKLDEIFN